MTWFKVDDGLHSHPKALAAGTAALGLWVRCGSWSAQHLTEGFVPEGIAELYGTKSMVAALLRSGLWLDADGGYQMHAFLERNPSKDDVETKRAAAAERQRRARERARESQRDSSVSHAPVTLPPTRPDPTRNYKTPSVSAPPAPRTAKQPMTEDWQPEPELLVWAKSEAPLVNVERETASFVDFFLDKGEKRPGWGRSWKRWIREAQERAEKRPALRAVPGDRLGSWDV